MDHKTLTAVNEYLGGFVTPARLEKIKKVLSRRTRYITVVLEDIFQPHNASAVLRSCECFGIQDVHIIENRYQYEVNPDVALGASKWLHLKKYNDGEYNSLTCLKKLKQRGYAIVATSPHERDFSPGNLPLEKPIALLFGTEQEGLTTEALEMADAFLRIPMAGFTESFNISVSAAICLYELTDRLRKSDLAWQLEPKDQELLMHEWLRASIKNPDLLIERFLENLSE